MNDLILNNNNESFPVSGRNLHEMLEIDTPYYKWFPRICEYGFTEGIDFQTNLSESTGGRPAAEHILTLGMAKHLCMIQRTPKYMKMAPSTPRFTPIGHRLVDASSMTC
jgi:anti-repressor protein